ncbi:MAG: flavoredoxin [Phormidesmis sp. CAN_BIN36]|nr:flavoredoxin [Phormidesmis sp. CAN_BIN36]
MWKRVAVNNNEAIVVRGGQNRPEDIRRGIGTHPSGVTGISVECGEGLSVEKLSASIPHKQVGVTTVGAIRSAGGDVIRTSGRSPYHATLIGLTPDEISFLLTPTMLNPSQQTL